MGSSMSVLDFLHLGSSMSLRRFGRFGSSLSVLGNARLGSSLSVLGCLQCGSSVSLRSVFRVGSVLSVSGGDVSDVPMVLYQTFSMQTMVHLGSSFSIYGILRLGKELSVLGSTNLGSSLSLRGGFRLGSALSVFDMPKMGASLSLRSLARFGSSMSVVGNIRCGNQLAVFDNLCLSADKVVDFEGWKMSWTAATSKLIFKADSASQQPLTITPTGGELHGTWSVESIVSSSDRRLKREILPLAQRLSRRTSGSPTATELLQALNPVHQQGLDPQSSPLEESTPRQERPRILFETPDVEKVLPDLVWPSPNSAPQTDALDEGVGKGIVYQDFLALLTLAAQERQRRLEEHQVREQQENERIQLQETTIAMLEKQVRSLRGRFTRLKSIFPIPPKAV